MTKEAIKKHKPDELPSQITRTVYVNYGIDKYNEGHISLDEHEGHSSSCGFSSVPLCEHVITLGIPPQSGKKLKGKVLKVLEAEKAKVLAENHARLQVVQEKIDNLLAIEYQGGKKVTP